MEALGLSLIMPIPIVADVVANEGSPVRAVKSTAIRSTGTSTGTSTSTGKHEYTALINALSFVGPPVIVGHQDENKDEDDTVTVLTAEEHDDDTSTYYHEDEYSSSVVQVGSKYEYDSHDHDHDRNRNPDQLVSTITTLQQDLKCAQQRMVVLQQETRDTQTMHSMDLEIFRERLEDLYHEKEHEHYREHEHEHAQEEEDHPDERTTDHQSSVTDEHLCFSGNDHVAVLEDSRTSSTSTSTSTIIRRQQERIQALERHVATLMGANQRANEEAHQRIVALTQEVALLKHKQQQQQQPSPFYRFHSRYARGFYQAAIQRQQKQLGPVVVLAVLATLTLGLWWWESVESGASSKGSKLQGASTTNRPSEMIQS
jgi:hypothetical protein